MISEFWIAHDLLGAVWGLCWCNLPILLYTIDTVCYICANVAGTRKFPVMWAQGSAARQFPWIKSFGNPRGKWIGCAFLWSYMTVSWNRGTPKSSILMGLSTINQPFWIPPFMEPSSSCRFAIWNLCDFLGSGSSASSGSSSRFPASRPFSLVVQFKMGLSKMGHLVPGRSHGQTMWPVEHKFPFWCMIHFGTIPHHIVGCVAHCILMYPHCCNNYTASPLHQLDCCLTFYIFGKTVYHILSGAFDSIPRIYLLL